MVSVLMWMSEKNEVPENLPGRDDLPYLRGSW